MLGSNLRWYPCKDKALILEEFRCDGVKDCAGGEDEIECCK